MRTELKDSLREVEVEAARVLLEAEGAVLVGNAERAAGLVMVADEWVKLAAGVR